MEKFNKQIMKKMQTIEAEVNKFREQSSNKKLSFENIFTGFHTYLYFSDKKLALWAVIKTLLNQGKSGIPVNMLDNQEENYYSVELNNFLTHEFPDLQVKSLQLSENEQKVFQEKSHEYRILKNSFDIFLQIFNLAEIKSWKEALVMASLLEQTFNSIEISIKVFLD